MAAFLELLSHKENQWKTNGKPWKTVENLVKLRKPWKTLENREKPGNIGKGYRFGPENKKKKIRRIVKHDKNHKNH